LGLAHIFLIINTTPMCIFYTREINLKPYFLYIQHGIRARLEPIQARIFGHSVPPAIGPLTDHPLISSSTHEMNIPRREGVCWKSHID